MSSSEEFSINEIIAKDDPHYWNRPTPVDCGTIRTIGIFLCLAAFIGILLNGALVYSFIRYQSLRSPQNIFIMFIATIGFVASTSILPLTGSSSIYCHWLFSRAGCQFEAVMAFLYGCSSSYLLCAVSLSRCYIIVRPFNAKDVTVRKCVVVACIVVSISFLWTMFPIIGWNEYTLEGARTSCCVNWYDRRTSYVAFNFFLFAFVYFIPLIVLITSNTVIYLGLKRMRANIAQGVNTALSHKRIEMEQRILKSIIITVFGFLVTWTPYAVAFFISVFYAQEKSIVSPLVTFICACFAKSSVMWIPVLYISTSTQFRLTFVDRPSVEKYLTNPSNGGDGKNASIVNKNNDKVAAVPTITVPANT